MSKVKDWIALLNKLDPEAECGISGGDEFLYVEPNLVIYEPGVVYRDHGYSSALGIRDRRLADDLIEPE